MKKIFITSFFAIMVLPSFAQLMSEETIQKQIATKARILCEYIVKVGTSTGQAGSVGNAEKENIIKNKVPSLFWNYREDPRYMRTTNGVNGNLLRKRPMYIYFTNLKRQSEQSLTTKTIYELKYEGFVNSNNSDGFKFEKNLSDGCKLYSATIRIRQRYHQINLSADAIEGRTIEKVEDDIKDYKVFIIVKPNGKAGVYIGDVIRAKRV